MGGLYFGFVDAFCQAVSQGWAFVFVSAVAVDTILTRVCVVVRACVTNFVFCICVILIGACTVSISKNAVVVSTYNVFKAFHTAIAYFHHVSVKKFVKSFSSWEVFVY